MYVVTYVHLGLGCNSFYNEITTEYLCLGYYIKLIPSEMLDSAKV